MADAKDILNRKGNGSMDELVGQKITVVEVVPGSSPQYGDNVTLKGVTEAGKEFEIRTGAVAIVDKSKELLAAGYVPFDATVITYPGQFNRNGYDFAAE